MTAVVYDPYSPAFRVDPYAAYASLRNEDPVHRSPLGFWVVTRYEDVAALVRDPRLLQEPPDFGPGDGGFDAGRVLVFANPPDHGRLRGLVSVVFGTRAVDRLRPRIERLTSDLLGPALDGGAFDLVDTVARPLPAAVICELLGVPHEARDELYRHIDALGAVADPSPPPERVERMVLALAWFIEYFDTLIEARRRRPTDDVLSGLVAVEAAGDRLDRDELLATCLLLFVAGSETTTNLIGAGTLALLEQPGAWARLRAEPGLTAAAVEELLRFTSPVQIATARRAAAPVEVRGRTIAPGEAVRLVIAAANHDPARFEDADSLVLDRFDNRHLAFGAGPHFCLGAALARAEAQAVFRALATRASRLELAGTPTWRDDSVVLRGLTGLPLSV